MKTNEELIKTIASNIATYRKKNGLTQLQLGEMLSYSDKAVSKWERGEGFPDIYVLYQLCDIFKITLNDLIDDEIKEIPIDEKEKKKERLIFKTNKISITIMSCILSWLIAIIVYVILEIAKVNIPLSIPSTWMCFIYPIPINFIILLVFTKLWGNRILRFFWVTGINWSVVLCLHLSLLNFTSIPNAHLVYLIGAVFQVLVIFWYIYRRKTKNKRSQM